MPGIVRGGWPVAAPRLVWLLAAALSAAAAPLRAETATPVFVEHAMPDPRDTPTAIAAGPDGSVWFTLDGAAALGRVRNGQVDRVPKPGRSVEPIGLAVGQDGSVWHTDAPAGVVARIRPDGRRETVALGTPLVRLARLTLSPDGAVWFAEPTSYSVTRLAGGVLTRHVVGPNDGDPYGVAVAPDGTVWATLQRGDLLMRIETDGKTGLVDMPPGSIPTDIAVAPDGALWVVAFRTSRLVRLKDGAVEEHRLGPDPEGLAGLAVAPDGTVWFGMLRRGALGSLKDGRLTVHPLPRPRARPLGVTVDPAGNVWYADITGFVGCLRLVEAGC